MGHFMGPVLGQLVGLMPYASLCITAALLVAWACRG